MCCSILEFLAHLQCARCLWKVASWIFLSQWEHYDFCSFSSKQTFPHLNYRCSWWEGFEIDSGGWIRNLWIEITKSPPLPLEILGQIFESPQNRLSRIGK